jgi:hypothetical protein
LLDVLIFAVARFAAVERCGMLQPIGAMIENRATADILAIIAPLLKVEVRRQRCRLGTPVHNPAEAPPLSTLLAREKPNRASWSIVTHQITSAAVVAMRGLTDV